MNPASTASPNDGILARIVCQFGRSRYQYHPSASAQLAGKNANAENFESVIRAVAVPNIAALAKVGRSIQISPARKLAPIVAVSAMSVVARPPCARIGGRKLKTNSAATPAMRPKFREPHQ